MDEKKQFSKRLRAAMVAAGHEPRPSVLEKHFNARYWGRSVTYQAVRRWLLGLSIPEQEKLQVLADWLHVEPQMLRYGTIGVARKTAKNTGVHAPHWDSIPAADQALIQAYLSLPEATRQHLRSFIAALR